ncbi:hypothetical protein BGZ63DRAFT_427985 [Mariannaea sp. PMI_226]|nr:hypothetical protein BGZ63DRAFT_427985 [Mariannaea sp. PMI_226]
MARTRRSHLQDRGRAIASESSRPTRTSARSHPPVQYGEDSSSDQESVSSASGAGDTLGSDVDDSDDVDEQLDNETLSVPHAHRLRQSNRSSGSPAQLRRSRRGAAQATLGSSFSITKPAIRQNTQKGKSKISSIKSRKGSSPKSSHTSKKRRLAPKSPDPPLYQGNIPDWRDPRMPYAAWTDIFYYAALSGGYDTLNVNWLIDAATTCRAFSEAALTAIYRNPPITNSRKAKRLATLLERSPSETRLNYRAKVESLYLDIQVIPQSVIYGIIHPLPRLKELVFFTQHDQPPYRELDRTVRWHYPTDIFQALEPSSAQAEPADTKPFHTSLKSWEWSGRLLGGPVASPVDIGRIHQGPSFAYLSKVSFTNFQVPSLYKPRPKSGDEEHELALYNEDGAVIQSIANAISQLKFLKHLVFESSTVMNHRLLPLLPKDLIHLGLINCWEVRSEDFDAFLHSHGRHLRTLSLLHNQSLDMSFLTGLADVCPNLEELRMNLSYFRHHDSLSLVNNDADPLYENALLPHQIPKWPASLRVIDFEHIRHWSVETAEMFLRSLIDSAGNFPNLRHLAVKTMLNIPWKARANMRYEWRKRLERVFLRQYQPPSNHKPMRHPSAEARSSHQEKPRQKRRDSDGPSRRSTRIAAQVSDSDSRQSSNSKGLRNMRQKPTYRDPDTDEDEFDEPSDFEDKDEHMSDDNPQVKEMEEEAVSAIQGLCTTVAVVFDNQKPTELQYGMEDFMDEDRTESDGEWDGDQDDEDPAYAW